MPYLIDGHNLIPKIPGLSLQAIDDEERLIHLLQGFCQRQQKDVEVFFDKAPAGQARRQKTGRLVCHFVRQGKSADSAIAERLQQLGGAAHNWSVVSSDHAVQAAARRARASVIQSEAFARSLLAPAASAAEPEEPDSDLSTEEWLRLFRQGRPKN